MDSETSGIDREYATRAEATVIDQLPVHTAFPFANTFGLPSHVIGVLPALMLSTLTTTFHGPCPPVSHMSQLSPCGESRTVDAVCVNVPCRVTVPFPLLHAAASPKISNVEGISFRGRSSLMLAILTGRRRSPCQRLSSVMPLSCPTSVTIRTAQSDHSGHRPLNSLRLHRQPHWRVDPSGGRPG